MATEISASVVAGVSPAKLAQAQPARLPLQYPKIFGRRQRGALPF
jgi:hypothetical protein